MNWWTRLIMNWRSNEVINWLTDDELVNLWSRSCRSYELPNWWRTDDELMMSWWTDKLINRYTDELMWWQTHYLMNWWSGDEMMMNWWTMNWWCTDKRMKNWWTVELKNWWVSVTWWVPDGTHVNLGSDLRVWMWVSETPFWDLTNVTLADEDTNWLCQ